MRAIAQPALTACAVQPLMWLALTGLSCSSCSFDDHPSIGRYLNQGASADASSSDSFEANAPAANPITETGGVGAQAAAAPTPMATSSADAGPSGARAADADAAAERSDAGSTVAPPPVDAGAQPSACEEGVYLGDFSCAVDVLNAAGIANTATVQVELDLRRSSSDELELASTSLAFVFEGLVFSADLVGQLDCATRSFHADIVNGVYASTLIPIPAAFAGGIDGTLDRTAPRLSGSWSFSDDAMVGTCAGTWAAVLQP